MSTIELEQVHKHISTMCDHQGPDLYAFIGFIGPDDDDLNWLLILTFDD